MNKKTLKESVLKALEAINLFSKAEDNTEVKEMFSAKVKDGEAMISYGELAVGSEVSISTGNGSELAPDGVYELDNGVSIEVKEGKISEVINAGEEAAKAEEVVAEEMAEEVKQPEEKVEDAPDANAEMEARLKAMEDAIAEIKSAMELQKSEFATVPTAEKVEGLFNAVEGLKEGLEILKTMPSEFSKTDTRVEAFEANKEKSNRLNALWNN